MRDASPGDPGNDDVVCSLFRRRADSVRRGDGGACAYLAYYRSLRLRASLISEKRFLFFFPSLANAKVSEPAVCTSRIICAAHPSCVICAIFNLLHLLP